MKTNGHFAAEFVDRAVAIEEQIASLREDKKIVFTNLKESMLHEFGDDPDTIKREMAAMRLVIKRRLESDDKKRKREEIEETAEQIMAALGMIADLPLGMHALRASIERGDVEIAIKK